jgi:preprotein translocase subunit YajC
VFAILVPLAASSGSNNSGGNVLGLLLPLVLMGGIFYFLLIRPQQRQRRRQADLLQSLEVGDEVQTIAGIYGTIREMDDESVMVEVAPNVELRMLRGAIARKLVFDDDDGYEDEYEDEEAPEEQQEEAGEQK